MNDVTSAREEEPVLLSTPTPTYNIPYELLQELKLSQRQKALLRAVTAGFAPRQIETLRELFQAEDEEKGETEKPKAITESSSLRPPALVIAALGAVAGFAVGSTFVRALAPKAPPSLKARIANWLLSDY